MCMPLIDAPTLPWWEIRPTGPTTTAPPPSPGWFYWDWCSTWLPLRRVRDWTLVLVRMRSNTRMLLGKTKQTITKKEPKIEHNFFWILTMQCGTKHTVFWQPAKAKPRCVGLAADVFVWVLTRVNRIHYNPNKAPTHWLLSKLLVGVLFIV